MKPDSDGGPDSLLPPSFRLARAAFLVIMAECTAHGRSLPRREGFAPHFPLCAITVNPHRGSISLFG
jgi:hypothetical protein